MTGAVVLEELRAGPRTTSELADAAGVSRNGVLCAIYGLAQAGHVIHNETPHGAHGDGRYRLTYDREHPTVRPCAWPGCLTHLSHTNSGPYCRTHKRGLALLMLARIDDLLNREEVTADDAEQLVLV